MVSTDVFAAINAEQLVTPMDRLVFRTIKRLEPTAEQLAAASSLMAGLVEERTVCVRPSRVTVSRKPIVVLCVAAAVAWLAVAASCLLV